MNLSLELIASARSALAGHILETPVEPSPGLSEILGAPAWLKLEFLQRTGSFKIRGALFRLASLTAEERRLGVVTCSAGNHGKAVAYAARKFDIPATIYVPQSVDAAKFRGMVALGAQVIRANTPGFDETQVWAMEEAAKAGLPFISAFDDEWVMAANGGTLAAEALEAVPQAKNFIIPVSGGGLGAGFAFYLKATNPAARLIACQHEGSPGLALSLERGQAVTRLPPIETVAGGIEGGIGSKTFPILQSRVDQVALVSEVALYRALRWMLDWHQYLIEPSAAATVAACIEGKVPALAGPVVLILSGRNVSLETVKMILDAGP